jgi:hypothetical protein
MDEVQESQSPLKSSHCARQALAVRARPGGLTRLAWPCASRVTNALPPRNLAQLSSKIDGILGPPSSFSIPLLGILDYVSMALPFNNRAERI